MKRNIQELLEKVNVNSIKNASIIIGLWVLQYCRLSDEEYNTLWNLISNNI